MQPVALAAGAPARWSRARSSTLRAPRPSGGAHLTAPRRSRRSLLVRRVRLLDDRLGMLPGVRFAHVAAGLDAAIAHAIVGRFIRPFRWRLPLVERHGSSRSAPIRRPV